MMGERNLIETGDRDACIEAAIAEAKIEAACERGDVWISICIGEACERVGPGSAEDCPLCEQIVVHADGSVIREARRN